MNFYKIDDRFILNHTSLDGFFFLRYIRVLATICFAGCILSWPVLLSVNATGGNKLSQLDLLTIGDVASPLKFYAHALIAWVFFGFILFMVCRECVFYINLRQAYLMSPQYANRLSARTVLFTCVPKRFLDERRIRKLFGDSVKNVWIPRNTRNLQRLIEEREKAAVRLEKAEIELIKKANKARNQKYGGVALPLPVSMPAPAPSRSETSSSLASSTPSSTATSSSTSPSSPSLSPASPRTSFAAPLGPSMPKPTAAPSSPSFSLPPSPRRASATSRVSGESPVPLFSDYTSNTPHQSLSPGLIRENDAINEAGEITRPGEINEPAQAVLRDKILKEMVPAERQGSFSSGPSFTIAVPPSIPISDITESDKAAEQPETKDNGMRPLLQVSEIHDDDDEEENELDYVHPYGFAPTLPDVRGSVAAQWIPAEARPAHRPLSNFGRRVDTIRWTRIRIKSLNRDIARLRRRFRAGDGTPLSSFFVEFDTQAAAQVAYQVLSHHQPLHMSPRFIGIRPEDIIWSSLRMRWWERIMRRFLVMGAVAVGIVFWSVPAAFVGVISNVSFLSSKIFFLHWIADLPKAITGVIEGLLPAVALSLLMAAVPGMLRGTFLTFHLCISKEDKFTKLF